MLDGRAEVSRPGPESVLIDGVAVRAGSRVVLRPRSARIDVLMRAVDGRRAIVESVVQDTEDAVLLVVAVEADPARTLGRGMGLGHRFFFAPDEVEPLPDAGIAAPPRRILVAGIGNVFMADDGFGVAVARRLSRCDLPDGVEVVDFGIRGMDLAYALNDGYHAAILVDAAPLDEPPGTLAVMEPDVDPDVFVGFHAHGMDPVTVLQFAQQFGSLPERTLVVGCQPHTVADPDGGDLVAELSPPVSAAVVEAVPLVRKLIDDLLEGGDR